MGFQGANNQVVCASCEEVVNSNAVHCPYCNCDLRAPLATRKMAPDALQEQLALLKAETKEPIKEPTAAAKVSALVDEGAETAFDTIVPLVALLAGGFFLFFAMLLKFFSKGGKLILEWRSDASLYFLLPALFLLFIGFMSLSMTKQDDH